MDRVRVLLVEDSPLFRKLIRHFVEAAGGIEIVGEVARADEAAPAVGEHRPDVVVMDWSLPDDDGISATRQVKALSPDVRVVALTSTTDPDVARKFREAGAMALFDKADLDGLVRWLGNALSP